jgi:hypothetical protein
MKTTALKLLTIVMLCIACVACGPSEQEKILEGRWIGSATTTDDDGDTMKMRLTFDFNRAKDLMKFRMDMSMPGVGDIMTVTMEGDWMADEEEITMFIDENSVCVSYASGLTALAYSMGVQVFMLEHQLETDLKNEIGIWDELPIISLASDKLVIDFDDTKVTLYKQ